MALTRGLRGLADRLRRRRDPPAASAPTMRWVHDEEAAAIVPGTIRREADVMRWLDRAPAHGGTLMLFPVDGAIVTENYVPIDPARGLAFIDQSFDNVPVPTGRPRPVAGETFALPAQTVTDIAGRVVVIGGIMAGNYFHGLMNWLARFPTLELLAPAIYRDPDVRFLVDEEVRAEPFMSILRALGVPLDRVIWHAHREADVRIEHALLPTFLHEGLICGDVYRAMQARIFQTLGIAWPERPRRRIWISREHEANARRRIANIAEIAPALDAHGFERVALETLSFADQVRLFADAQIVAGSHGAGFSNLIFTPPGSRALIIEKDFALFLGPARLFESLAVAMGRGYDHVPATSIFEDGTDYGVFVNRHFADAVVDPAAFAEALDRTVAAAEAETAFSPIGA